MSTSDIQKKLLAGFQNLGIQPGDTLVTHSSLSSFGEQIDGGAHSVIQSLFEAVGDEGTLLFPALSFLNVTPQQPEFDARKTPCCIGVIPETFRKDYAQTRSIHPTHSVCATGPLAKKLTQNHYLDTTPCGSNSPFSLLPQFGAKVLMLGCSLNTNTSMHAIEELDPPGFLLGDEVKHTIINLNGESSEQLHLRHEFKGLTQRYDRILPHLPKSAYSYGKVLGADSYLIDLKALWETAIPIYKANPRHFIEVVST